MARISGIFLIDLHIFFAGSAASFSICLSVKVNRDKILKVYFENFLLNKKSVLTFFPVFIDSLSF